MADLTSILGAWAPTVKHIDTPDAQLRDAMLIAGLTPPADFIFDGKVHRFASGTKGEGGHSKPGWYVMFDDGFPAGRFGCWRSGVELTFRAEIGRTITVAEEMAYTRRMADAKQMRDAEQAKAREVAANTVDIIWQGGSAASAEHPYLTRKGIQPHGARVTGDGRLMVPLYSADGQLSSIQYIAADGDKKYHPGGATGSMFWTLGTVDKDGCIYIAEGYATSATIHEVSGDAVLVAYSASNILQVTKAAKEKYPKADICIVADNDASGVGMRYAEQASAKYGVRMVMPNIQGDANDYALAGHDLAELLTPKSDSGYLVHADGFCEQPAPIKWLVKNWIQDDALCMVHGPSGGGKTFVVLDWMLHIASGKPTWQGNKVRDGHMVYLAGEGHHGLRSRIAAWKHHNQVQSVNMWISKAGCDLNTPEGYLKVVSAIRSLNIAPDVITVDTLHRFMAGDENSSQDAKTMLDACAGLMAEFNCTVILVHHTGVSEEAQHRARGSSAWRGALDIEISVVPAKGDKSIEIVQRKSKDAEMAQTVFVDLESVAIPNWFDEDGEPVTSAVVVAGAAAPVAKSTSTGTGFSSFERAWFDSGVEVRNGAPYLTRSALVAYGSKNGLEGTETKRITNVVKPDLVSGTYIAPLIKAGLIEPHEFGWIVKDAVQISAMMLKK